MTFVQRRNRLTTHFSESIPVVKRRICVCVCVCVYRVFHDLWTLLQEVISYVFVIKKVHINMCPILDGYGVMGIV